MQPTNSETIAAIATPPGEGAIATLRISGNDTADILERIFSGHSSPSATPRKLVYGNVISKDGLTVDEVLAAFFSGPASYTGEDMAEISCHGGMVITRLVLDTILAAGARQARPGEFTERAFLNGKLDMTQAEAVMDLIAAQTELAAHAASEQLQGALGSKILELRNELLAILAEIEADIDFPDEDITAQTANLLTTRVESVLGKLANLLDTAQRGRILREGARLVIFGEPNAGKSSLLNRLLGYQRAIVSEQPGTTRDTIEEIINIGGYPVRLVDTAGMRDSVDEIELAGMQFTRARLATADLILHVIDASQPKPVSQRLPDSDAQLLRILNKCDLGMHPDWHGHDAVQVSCLNGNGLEQLEQALLAEMAGHTAHGSASAVAINARHRSCLQLASEHCRKVLTGIINQQEAELVAIDLREGLAALGEIVGAVDNEDLLGEIFSRFCIGK